NKLMISSMYGSSRKTQLISGTTTKSPIISLIKTTPSIKPSTKEWPEKRMRATPEMKMASGNLNLAAEMNKSEKINIDKPAMGKAERSSVLSKKTVVKCKIAYNAIEIRSPHAIKDFIMHPFCTNYIIVTFHLIIRSG